jgi:NUMOD3 motif
MSKVGRPLSEEHKQELSLALKGRVISEATKEKMSLTRNTSGFRGVYFHSRVKKFAASIRVDERNHHLGYFDDPELAYVCYCEAAQLQRGAA